MDIVEQLEDVTRQCLPPNIPLNLAAKVATALLDDQPNLLASAVAVFIDSGLKQNPAIRQQVIDAFVESPVQVLGCNFMMRRLDLLEEIIERRPKKSFHLMHFLIFPTFFYLRIGLTEKRSIPVCPFADALKPDDPFHWPRIFVKMAIRTEAYCAIKFICSKTMPIEEASQIKEVFVRTFGRTETDEGWPAEEGKVAYHLVRTSRLDITLMPRNG